MSKEILNKFADEIYGIPREQALKFDKEFIRNTVEFCEKAEARTNIFTTKQIS